ncbi:MAG TPA: TonB-dependent receptor [Vicinamibacterales bacterium]|nr:TonB-dependent receptor [Vicinamibacterales bacterium]
MKSRLALWLVLGALVAAPAVSSAQQPGEIFGKVSDTSGAVMPGVTVTLTSPVLLQPQVAMTSESGTYRFPQLAVGVYTVRFELPGFTTVVREGIRIEIGFNAQINATMAVSSVQETVTVTGESPIVDTRDTGRGSRFNQEALQAIPSARDPWVILEQSAGVAMDRSNVGGSQSGQQSNFVARGAAFTEQKWNLDGVDITDMAATGGSPIYFDFDAFEEMQISTGGADVSMQSPGVSVNIVTKSGTDQFRGATRFYITDEKFQDVNITDELRRQGATTGNPIQNIKDYGVEAGGPLKRGRAWIWGSYGRQNISVGVNNFYKPTAECQAMKAALRTDPLAYSVDEVRGCLSSDSTELNNYNAKFSIRTFKNNQASMFFNGAEKVRNARDASDLRPIETTWRQMGVTRKDLGSNWWKTGMPKSYKWSDRHIFTDRLLVEASYAHVGNNFTLTFHEEDLRSVQPTYEISTGLWGRSYYEDVYVRPTDSIDVMGNYFVPGLLGGDHSLKFGFKWRNDVAIRETMYGGDAYARFRNGVPVEAQIYRRAQTESLLMNRNVYLQDSYVKGRYTIIAGLRFDYQTDDVRPTGVDASQFYGQPTFAGVYNKVTYTGRVFDQLPAASFGGAKALGDKGHAFVNWSPRIGLSYDITGDGRTVAKFNYARYTGQLGGNSGLMATRYNPMVLTYVRYPWVDLNLDQVIQANEVVYTAAPLSWTTGYDYRDPTKMTTTGTVDPDITNEKTDEIIVSFDRQMGTDFAVGASYIWRKYTNFRNVDLIGFDADNWTAVTWTPTCTAAGADCPTVTYYQPTSQIPTNYLYTNVKDFWRGYQGFELTARKRFSDNWQVNGSYSYNDAPMHFDSPAGYVWWTNDSDPTNIETSANGGQFAPQSTTSGIDNVYVNARWIARLSGSYTLPWYRINLAAFYNARSGYPYIRSVQSPVRPFSAGQINVFLDKRGDVRLPNFQTMDFRVDKSFSFGRLKVVPSLDVFNLFNGNTVLAKRGLQTASNANTISALLAPRVLRFGFRATW